MLKNIIEAIDLNGKLFPETISYSLNGKDSTYGELLQASDKIANFITHEYGGDDHDPIIIFGGQSFNMLAAFLGCVKSGHAYIPVDINSPKEKLEQIGVTAETDKLIFTDDGESPYDLKDIKIWQIKEILECPTFDVAAVSIDLDDNFYIIFTSGTTGTPKGVQITHANLLSFVNWMINDFGLSINQNVLSQAPFSFDLSVMDIFPTLVNHGTLKGIDNETSKNFARLFDTIEESNLNVWVSTPSFAEMNFLNPKFNEENFGRLATFLFCGEELTNKTAAELLKRFPHAAIFNTYGPTEATVAVTSIQITHEIIEAFPRLPIGYVKPDTTIVVDLVGGQENNSGELIIQGPSVSKGYLNNAEKTAESFSGEFPNRRYLTGDLGSIDAEGLVSYQGRKDFQVKLHGFRIELEDIERNLEKLDCIKQAIAVPKNDKSGKTQNIVAYIVSENDDSLPNPPEIKRDLKEIMMDYMIPQRFIEITEMPISANGKIDRKFLNNEVNR